MSKASTEHPTPDHKTHTKDSFNRRLNANIIRDDQSSPIKKKGSEFSPKKLREEVINLNQQEMQLQKEILHLHQKNKNQLN